MLKIDLTRIFATRGYSKPILELVRLGISRHVAHNLVSGKTESINNRHLELICGYLRCTPNDLYAWEPGKDVGDVAGHPLRGLMRDDSGAELAEILSEVPLDKLKEARDLIASLKNSD